MSQTNTGGPAFPHKAYLGEKYDPARNCREPIYSEQPGAVTLRDYLASHVQCGEAMNQKMGEIIAGRTMPSMNDDPVTWFAFWFEVEAKLRYMKADAMIAERLKGGAS